MIRSREMSGTSWTGPAAAAFGTRMDHIRSGQDQLAGDVMKAAETFDQFAEGLRTAQAGMARTVDAAIAAGLQVAGTVISEPSSIGECWADPVVQAASDARHQRLLAAYETACAEARSLVLVFSAAATMITAVWREIVEKQVMLAAEFVGKTIERFSEARISELRTKAQALESNPVIAQWRSEPGISGQQLKTTHADIAKFGADEFGGKFLGKVATAGSIAYDIAHGKPPVKSIATNLAETTASSLIGNVIAKQLTTKTLGMGAAVIASGGGALAGVVVGVAAELAWDALPQSVRDKIEKGANDLFEAGKKAVATEWHHLENTADKIWRMFF
ncbi:hypothetical protein [Amycolatopsis sp. PS_44_ISF1]|uniref:hypothetical protein n=1 Tax=Amycolatopsis sp. PS_44_ISF1 TaxID=2974917 RepID=UPI0028DEB588|nr:hypothetical protein [Amycolatopsis sp. PS_44_ISF1]MDT8913599.1 hypothetical protein [Amycolatopsis sp. PS_44_ISF1]